MYYTKINKLIFNDNTELEIASNDIVIFVGPNNSGKSQSLKDIYKRMSKENGSVVIKDICLENGSIDELKQRIADFSYQDNPSNPRYNGFGYTVFNSEFNQMNDKLPSSIRGFLVSFLKTEERLTIANPPEAIEKEETKRHPIHYLAYNIDYEKRVSEYFNQAFGQDLTVNQLKRKRFPLCIGPKPVLANGADMPTILEKLSSIIDKYPVVHEQGDGIRSFTGIVLNLILEQYGIFLIDEPESFLHPPQAKILGKIIAEMLGNERQAFISTHSEEIIKGLMDSCPERIKVIRITRDKNINKFSILQSNEFVSIWKDPLLKHSNIMNSLFHKTVVLCESESDCRLYSIIHEHLKIKAGLFSETLFIYCSGKSRLGSVIKALRSLGIDYRCIPDIDLLNSKDVLQNMIQDSGGTWDDDLQKTYNNFASQLNGGKGTMSKDEVKLVVDEFLNKYLDEKLGKQALENLKKQLAVETKWTFLKSGGEAVLNAGECTKCYLVIKEKLMKLGVFIVPVGELERFITTVGGHGPGWVNSVLEQYPDLDNPIYDKVKDFVKTWNL